MELNSLMIHAMLVAHVSLLECSKMKDHEVLFDNTATRNVFMEKNVILLSSSTKIDFTTRAFHDIGIIEAKVQHIIEIVSDIIFIVVVNVFIRCLVF